MAQKAKKVVPPRWFHLSGRRIVVQSFCPERRELVLVDERNPTKTIVRLRVVKRWRHVPIAISWRMNRGQNGMSAGRVYLSAKDVVNAFGLTPFDWTYLNDTTTYARESEWLVIPQKGTGDTGDPNVSIMLTPNIQDGVRKLVRLAP